MLNEREPILFRALKMVCEINKDTFGWSSNGWSHFLTEDEVYELLGISDIDELMGGDALEITELNDKEFKSVDEPTPPKKKVYCKDCKWYGITGLLFECSSPITIGDHNKAVKPCPISGPKTKVGFAAMEKANANFDCKGYERSEE